MPSLMPLPVFQAFDLNGDPLEGGKLYTYEAGTSTPKATFIDASGVTANTNPIILDAAGQAIVYLVGSYKLVLTDADDVLQSPYPIDGVREIPGAAASVTEWNASGLVPSYVNATTFSVAGDQRTLLHVGRRVKLTQSGSTRYGTIATSVYSSVTTITITDAGALDATLSGLEVGFVSSENSSVTTQYGATVLQGVDAAAWRTNLGVTSAATPAFTGDASITTADDGAAVGPTLDLYRNSTTAAASDLLAAVLFSGKSVAGTKRSMARIIAKLIDATDASEDANLVIETIVAGTPTTIATVGGGLAVGATAVDPGVGQVNATNGYQFAGVSLPHQVRPTAALQNLVAGGNSITFAHGRSYTPHHQDVRLRYKCIDAGGEHGYAQNEFADVFTFANAGGNMYGLLIRNIDATNVVVDVGDAGALVMNKTTRSAGTPTLAKWQIEMTILGY